MSNGSISEIENSTPLSLFAFYADYVLGVGAFCITLIGLVSNVLVILLFTMRSAIKSRTTFLLRSLAISDLTMALVGGSMYSISAFHHRWCFKRFGCDMYAFLMYWCGVTSIAHLVAISVERSITMNNPVQAASFKNKTPPYLFVMVAISWLYGLLWAILPFVGMHTYAIEGRISCSLDWKSDESHATAYNITIFFTTFILPAAALIGCNGQILYMVKKTFSARLGDKAKEKNLKTEWKLTKNLMQTAGFYVLAWSPYAVVSMWAAFGDDSTIPQVLLSSLALFAKLSFAFNPFVYCFSNQQNKSELKKMLGITKKKKKESRTPAVAMTEIAQENQLNATTSLIDADPITETEVIVALEKAPPPLKNEERTTSNDEEQELSSV